MGGKHSAYSSVDRKNETERSRQSPIINDAFKAQFHSQFTDPYNTFNRRQSMVYNFNCLPPKPPRANAENVGGRMSQQPYTSSPIDERKNYRIQDTLNKQAQCPICYNLYDNPHVLPCQHTFCKKCIASLQTNIITKTIDCPICREKHVLQNGVESLTANYTMKKLIELESIATAERDKEEINSNESKAKCFGCQKYAFLKVCSDCSYMLCPDCVDNPDHDYIIESKINSKKYLSKAHRASVRIKPPTYEYARKHDLYSEHRSDEISRLKLTLLCHSSAVEEELEKNLDQNSNSEVFEDEFGKCKTFQKISISAYDRVITLKKIVERKFGILTKDQILVYKDQILKSDLKALSHYGLRQFSRIHIFDERDIKDSNDEEEDLYGIYQDTNLIQSNESVEEKASKKDDTCKVSNISQSTKSSSSSGQIDSSFEKTKPNRSKYYTDTRFRSSVKRMDSKRSSVYHNEPIQNGPYRNYYSQYPRSTSKYATMKSYRKLDELFDRQININNTNY
ncbi:unnamed protein product [Brachionus calyciflorus]|uniref:Uncharacterized protein n=1 Tax=Brachionus calyciflorus TaxID=104777 RepID=A0A814AX33_9BILA|nr:unnamed protein product [Brachionus calyciflorus]